MEAKPGVKLSVDGVEVSVAAGSTVIKAAELAGKLIPHFCYHPGLSVVGQCRMCFVEIEGAPKLATACSTPVAEGMKILTATDKVKSGQNATLEFTLLNHPLDCPICDRGGECKLQDYTYEFGPPLSRMVDEKKENDKHRAISSDIVLDQERCILCTRCVRFSSEVDGKAEIVVQNRGYLNVVDVFEGRPFSSNFQGNVVDICPVGALTAKDYRFAARPWELKTHDALCTGCAVGCNIEVHTKNRHGGITRPDGLPPLPQIKRLVPRDNMEVNTWWLCDKGRWGYHFNNEEEKRLEHPLVRRSPSGALEKLSLKEAQLYIEKASTENLGEWEFWVDDNVPHEEISWAKEMLSSWQSRGRKVQSRINPSVFGESFLKYWASRATSPWFAAPVSWHDVKVVASPYDYRELENIAPILALRLGQAFRKGQIRIEKLSESEMSNFKADAYLVNLPKDEKALGFLNSLASDAKVIPLFTQANSRGLVNEGIAPIEALSSELKNKKAQGPVFLFSQRTQNAPSPELVAYLKSAPFVIVADSFQSPLTQLASLVLPLTPLYETPATLTNLENRRQKSPGIQVSHPNHSTVQRGGPLVHPSLRLL